MSAVVGRARGLLLPALALGLGLGGLAALDVRADTVAAPFDVRVTDPARLQDTYRAAAGTATLDLADLETPAATPSGSPRRVEVELTAGQLRLVVPTDVRTRVVVHARNGTAYRAAASGRIATNDPELVARWRAAGIPRPGSALDSAALARLRNGELETWDRTLTNGRSLTTGPRGDVDLVVDATVGLGDIVVVEPVWSELPTKLIEPEQLCTVGGGPRGVVEPCSEVAADQRVALCLNDGGYLVDCREDRPASWDNPRIAACRDSGGQPIDCAAVGIDPAGAELVSPDAGEDPSATIAPADPTDPTDPTVTGDPALSPDPTDPSLPPGTVAPAPTLTVPPIGG